LCCVVWKCLFAGFESVPRLEEILPVVGAIYMWDNFAQQVAYLPIKFLIDIFLKIQAMILLIIILKYNAYGMLI
jgi:hypothetical protein